MSEVYLLGLAAKQRDWLSIRQATVAQNVANLATPGYRRVDVEPFEAVMKQSQAGLSTTHTQHIQSGGGLVSQHSLASQQGWERSHSGNGVSVEQEMLTASDVGREFTLNVNITKSFHDMLLAGLRG